MAHLEQPFPDRERHMTQSPKLRLTVAWNPLGFHVLTAFPRGVKFTAGLMQRKSSKEKKLVEGQRAGNTRKLIVHADPAK
jgi:hypothetical protein